LVSISSGYRDIDSLTINFPSNMVVESMPKPIKMQFDFGEFSFDIKQADGKITIIQTFLMRSGKYPKEKNQEFLLFMNALSKVENSNVVLKKVGG
jgi:hypothetical protein